MVIGVSLLVLAIPQANALFTSVGSSSTAPAISTMFAAAALVLVPLAAIAAVIFAFARS